MKIREDRAVPLLLATLLSACSSSGDGPPPTSVSVDTDYVLALSAANTFLSAWQRRDQDVGITMLSPRLLQSRSEADWRMSISGVSDPHHQAYEITSGRRLPDGRFAFAVWLHEHYTGFKDEPSKRREPDTIIVVKVGAEKWRVDKTPGM